MKQIQKILPYIIIVLSFIVITYAFFPRLLLGERLVGTDNQTSIGMSKEARDYNANNKDYALWTNSMFGGMPTTFVAGPKYDNLIPPATRLFSKILPYPFNCILIGLIGFFILLLSYRINKWTAFVGAIAYALFTMTFVLLATGHNTKAVTIMLFPWTLAGLKLIFNKKYTYGFILLALSLSWQLYGSHLQMTYYLIFLCAAYVIAEIVIQLKEKHLKTLLTQGALILITMLLVIGTHSAKLWTEYEDSKYTIRGESELTKDEDTTSGLDKSYILDYSYDLGEALTCFIPRFKGGGMAEPLGENSAFYKELAKTQGKQRAKQYAENAPLYWGSQPISGAPFYYGAVFCFLFVLGLFLVKGRDKWWIIVTVVVAFLLSLGKYLPGLANFMVDYFPGYNKFRDVKNIIVIQHFAMALMGVLAIKEVYERKIDNKAFMKSLKVAFGITGGLALIFALIPGLAGNFEGATDARYIQMGWPQSLIDAIQSDRKTVLRADAFHTFIFVALAAAGLWAYWTKKLKAQYALALWAVLVLGDMWPINKKYLNNDDFVSKRKAEVPYTASKADQAILQDKSLDYRVLNMAVNPWSDASTSYFHKSIGGYHGAKMQRYQELIEHGISPDMMKLQQGLRNIKTQADVDNLFNGLDILNMLNTKYVIYNKDAAPLVNASAMGNAWFVPAYKMVENADAEIAAIKDFDVRKEAIVDERFAEYVEGKSFGIDSTASIKLTKYAPNALEYYSNSSKEQLAVFSEIYYPAGWKAYVDGAEVPHFRVNYVLRSMVIPAGEHEIKFEFKPHTYYAGNKISLISSIILLLATAGVVVVEIRKKKVKA